VPNPIHNINGWNESYSNIYDIVKMITTIIEAEKRGFSTSDIPNAFIQAEKQDQDGQQTIMIIQGLLVEIICEMNPKY